MGVSKSQGRQNRSKYAMMLFIGPYRDSQNGAPIFVASAVEVGLQLRRLVAWPC